jgi:hypothetical protein
LQWRKTCCFCAEFLLPVVFIAPDNRFNVVFVKRSFRCTDLQDIFSVLKSFDYQTLVFERNLVIRNDPFISWPSRKVNPYHRMLKLGYQYRFQRGKVNVNYNRFLGYTKGEDGKLEIVPEEAEVS